MSKLRNMQSTFLWLFLALVTLSAGCRDRQKEAEAKLDPLFTEILPLVERDTKQIRDGLPKGAAIIAKHLDEDPGADPAALQRAIQGARAGVYDLEVCKGTFFVFVDEKGTVLRSQDDPDLAAGASLTESVPDAKKIFTGKGLTEVWGTVHGFRGFEKGDDMQWIVGAPVTGKEGALRGAFVTGWSLRKYAESLEVLARDALTKKAENPDKPIELLYVLFAKGDRAFGGGLTPDVNVAAVAKLDVVKQSANGTYKTTVTVEGREFVVAARRAPALAEDVAIVFMISAV